MCPEAKMFLTAKLWRGLALSLLVIGLVGIVAGQGPGDGTKPAAPRREEEEEDKAPPKKRPPRVEEEEDPRPRPKKVIRVEEPDDPPAPAAPPTAPVGDLRRAAAQTKNAYVKTLFEALATPQDIAVKVSGTIDRLVPIEQRLPRDPGSRSARLEVRRASDPSRTFDLFATPVKSITHYEDEALERVKEFLDRRLHHRPMSDPQRLSRLEQLAAAETVLVAVLRFHESARETGERKGADWEPVTAELRKALREAVLEQLDELADAGNWDAFFQLTRRLIETYPRPDDQAAIARRLTELLPRARRSGVLDDNRLRDVRAKLRLLEEQYSGAEAIRPITESLQKQAQDLLDEARKEMARPNKDLNRVRDLIRQAEEAYPNLVGLREFSMELGRSHPVLRIGVRSLPQFLSPARATTDAELRTLDLLFESLVKLTPDATGATAYRPGLAQGRPRLLDHGVGRRFYLPPNAFWSNNQPITVSDVRFSVRQLKGEIATTGRSPAWGELLQDVIVSDQYRVDLHLVQGWLDPLAPMGFKLLPQGTQPESLGFAKQPIGSGPYRFEGIRTDRGREYAGFLVNPGYTSRVGSGGLPRIREIRLYATSDPLTDLKEHLHLVLDLTAAQQAELRKVAAANNLILPLPTPATPINRRVHFLAVNHRRPGLDSAEVRQAIAFAIDREKLLDDHFRGGLHRLQVHKSLNSPYPAQAWCCDPSRRGRDGESLDPFDAAAASARAKLDRVQNRLRTIRLTLKYSKEVPEVEAAMQAVREQVQQRIGLQLELVPLDPWSLRADVEERLDYDLAYYHHDFEDDTFWLKPLLGPRGRSGNENYLGYRGDLAAIEQAAGSRNFLQVQELSRRIHRQLTEEMPVIPLWQLDPFYAYRADKVELPPLDPQALFAEIELWRLK
jgi:ABC-type oligopeptide transport system substrate-binding subunit